MRDLVALIWVPKPAKDTTQEDIVTAIQDLREFGQSISGNHAVWGDYIMRKLVRRKTLTKELMDLEGM